MFVAVHHRISDPEKYWSTVSEAAGNLPSDLELRQCLPKADGREAFCVWEGNSVEHVRDFVEAGVGEVSTNEYVEVEHGDGVHVPTSFGGG